MLDQTYHDVLTVKDERHSALAAYGGLRSLTAARAVASGPGNPAHTGSENHMANWYGSARSNYVRVKDAEAFTSWVSWVATLPDVELVEKEGTFALLVGRNSEHGGWPSFRVGAEDDGDEDIDIAAEVAGHLAPGEVFVFCECGAEKLRNLTGWATAVNETGETLHVSIEDIYTRAKKRWNCEPTTATY